MHCGRSFRTSKEKEMIQMGKENAEVEVFFQKADRDGKIKINFGTEKNVFFNGVPIKKLSDLLR